eukprot:9863017-Ditylum_brightwellii.AAC.1
MDETFQEQLAKVQAMHSHLIDPSVDVSEEYGISRSMCRGSHSHETNQNVDDKAIKLQNHWKTFENSQGS